MLLTDVAYALTTMWKSILKVPPIVVRAKVKLSKGISRSRYSHTTGLGPDCIDLHEEQTLRII